MPIHPFIAVPVHAASGLGDHGDMVKKAQTALALPSHRRYITLVALTSVAIGTSCVRPIRSGAMIDAYRKADCVYPMTAVGIQPPTRGWNRTIALAVGSKATIQGAEKIAGQILVRYEPDGSVETAAKPGDYIYPSDVRHDAPSGRLYVKARGLAGGMSDQTWLYEYDLKNRKQLRKQRVYPDALPQECDIRD
jgi:hypothetical protein